MDSTASAWRASPAPSHSFPAFKTLHRESTIPRNLLQKRCNLWKLSKLCRLASAHSKCATPFGNPCGPGRACADTDTGFTCSPPINQLGCPVGCGQNSECIEEGSTSGFNCECLEGFSRPRPFLSWGQNASSKIDYPSKPLWITSSPQAS